MKTFRPLAAIALLLAASNAASAQLATATQVVNITVSAVDNFTVSGGAVSLTVGIGTTTNASTATYAIQTNSVTARSINAQITAGGAFPTGVTVTTNLQAPTNGTSAGAVTLLAASATPVVTGITQSDNATRTITYSVTASATATPGTLTGRTITYTLQ